MFQQPIVLPTQGSSRSRLGRGSDRSSWLAASPLSCTHKRTEGYRPYRGRRLCPKLQTLQRFCDSCYDMAKERGLTQGHLVHEDLWRCQMCQLSQVYPSPSSQKVGSLLQKQQWILRVVQAERTDMTKQGMNSQLTLSTGGFDKSPNLNLSTWRWFLC